MLLKTITGKFLETRTNEILSQSELMKRIDEKKSDPDPLAAMFLSSVLPGTKFEIYDIPTQTKAAARI